MIKEILPKTNTLPDLTPFMTKIQFIIEAIGFLAFMLAIVVICEIIGFAVQ